MSWLRALLAIALLALAGSHAGAQAPHPLGGPRSAPAVEVSGGGAMAWVRVKQVDIHRRLTAAVKEVRDGDPWRAGIVLCVLAFAYGLLHALGPGHGKAVISTYVLANEDSLRRVLVISALSSLAQAVTAVALVYAVLFVAEQTTRRLTDAALGLEMLANGLVAGIGFYLLARAWKQWRTATPGHEHGENCGCGHHHFVQLKEPQADWRTLAGIVLSVGARPCSGAILILVFAYSLGLHLAGIAATFAMAAGTGLVVAAVAAMAHAGRTVGWAAGRRRGWNLKRIGAVVTAVGGMLLVLLGALLLTAPAMPGVMPMATP
ncbi:MAG: nickel/cobalt transporter [Magnetospirillum sp. WYHS-4]